MSNGTRIALVVADGFIALTAVAGSSALVAGLEARRLLPAWLEGIPLHTTGP